MFWWPNARPCGLELQTAEISGRFVASWRPDGLPRPPPSWLGAIAGLTRRRAGCCSGSAPADGISAGPRDLYKQCSLEDSLAHVAHRPPHGV